MIAALGVSMRTKITKAAVDAAVSGQFLWGIGLKGFGLKVTAGGSKVYILQYGSRGGGRGSPTKRYPIGRHGPLTPQQGTIQRPPGRIPGALLRLRTSRHGSWSSTRKPTATIYLPKGMKEQPDREWLALRFERAAA